MSKTVWKLKKIFITLSLSSSFCLSYTLFKNKYYPNYSNVLHSKSKDNDNDNNDNSSIKSKNENDKENSSKICYEKSNELSFKSVYSKDLMYPFISDQEDKIIFIEDEDFKSNTDLDLHKSVVKFLNKNKGVREIRIKRQEAMRLTDKNNNKNLIIPAINAINSKVILINKTGDVESYSSEEFIETMEKEEIIPMFQDIKLISSKEDFMNMNDHDHMLLMYVKTSDNKKFFSYDSSEFRFFRNLLYKLNFFNIKYLVATEKQSSFLSDLNLESGVYLVNRKEFEQDNQNKQLLNNDDVNKCYKDEFTPITYKENLETFQFYNIPQMMMYTFHDSEFNFDEISRSNTISIQSFLNITMRQGLNFYCYTNNNVGLMHGVELLPMFFKNIPYYLLFTDLSIDSNRKNFQTLRNLLSKYYSNSVKVNNLNLNLNQNQVLKKGENQLQYQDKNALFIVIDNEKFTENQFLVKTFKDKFFNTELSNNDILEAPLENFKPVISKKIIFKNMDKIEECLNIFDTKLKEVYYTVNDNSHTHCYELLNMIKTDDIKYKDNNFIDKETKNKVFQVDHVLLKDLMDQLQFNDSENKKQKTVQTNTTNNVFKRGGLSLYDFERLIILVKNREETLNRKSEVFLYNFSLNKEYKDRNRNFFVTINNSDSNLNFIKSLINEKCSENFVIKNDENSKITDNSKIKGQKYLPYILILSKDSCILHAHNSLMGYSQESFDENIKEVLANLEKSAKLLH